MKDVETGEVRAHLSESLCGSERAVARRQDGELRPVRNTKSAYCHASGPDLPALKYLYLLFDPTSSRPLSNLVYNTEGHPLSLPFTLLQPPPYPRRALHRGENAFCPIYEPEKLGGGLTVGIERRSDYEYARQLVFGPGVDGRAAETQESIGWWEGGFCAMPVVPRHVGV